MKKIIFTISIIVLLYSLIFPILYFFPQLNESIGLFFYLASPLFAIIIIVGSITSVFYLVMFFIKKRNISHTIRFSCYLFLLSFLVFPTTFLFPKPLPTGSFELSFSENIWKNNEFAEITNRQKMLGDLINNILPGKNENEIIQLLGKPYYRDNKNYIIGYELGAERDIFLRLDSEWLEISFDENGNYRKSSVNVD